MESETQQGNATAAEIRASLLQQEANVKVTEESAVTSSKSEGDNKDTEGDAEDSDEDFMDSLFEEQAKTEKKELKEEDLKEEDSVTDEDEELINKVVDKKLKPFQDEANKAEIRKVEADYGRYVSENPQFEKYQDNIKPYVGKLYNTFVKQGVTLEDGTKIKISEGKYNDFVTSFVLGRGMLKIGASMKNQADRKANDGSQSSASNRKSESDGIPDVANMSRDEFKKLQSQVMRGSFNPS